MNSSVNSSELLSQPDQFEVSAITLRTGESRLCLLDGSMSASGFLADGTSHTQKRLFVLRKVVKWLVFLYFQCRSTARTPPNAQAVQPDHSKRFDFGVIGCTSAGWSSNRWAAAWFTRYENYCRSWRFCRTCSLTRWSLPSKKSPRWHLVSRNFDCAACCLAVSLAPWLGPLFSIETTFWISPLFEAGNVVDHGSYSVNVISQRPFAGS